MGLELQWERLNTSKLTFVEHKRIVRSRPQMMGHSLTSARACSLAKIDFCPHETRGSYSQGSRDHDNYIMSAAQVRRLTNPCRPTGRPITAI